RKQQVHLSPEPSLERPQQTPLEALGQEHAVDIEAFVYNCRRGSVKLPSPNCECKHLEVAGEDHVGAAHMLSEPASLARLPATDHPRRSSMPSAVRPRSTETIPSIAAATGSELRWNPIAVTAAPPANSIRMRR